MKNIKFLMLIISVLMSMKFYAQESTETYYEPELLMVSQPKMELYTANDEDYAQFYYDVKNIGSETYKGDFIILMEPDVDHYYVKKSIKVKAGEIKRIKLEMDLGLLYYDSVYSVLPVYEFENQWYPLTAYEQFKSISLCLNAPMDVDYVVTKEPEPVVNYSFDVHLQRPPVYGYYYVTPPPGWAYAYGYNPCCVYNNYVVFNGNNWHPGSGVHIVAPVGGTVVTTTVNHTQSAPRVSGNRYHNSAAVSAGGSNSRRYNGNSGGANVSSGRSRTVHSGSSGVSTSGSRTSSSAGTSSSSSSQRTSSAKPTTTNSSSAISNSSSSRSSSARSSSNSSSSRRSSSKSSSSSSSSSSRSGGGRR